MNQQRVVLGRIAGLFGVKGWVKVFSYTEPRDNIAAYPCWQLQLEERSLPARVEACQAHGASVIAKLEGWDDRAGAAEIVGAQISVERSALPTPDTGSYYWSDLEELEVETVQGDALGRVHHLIATGAHDVLVVHGQRERLIPFVSGETVKRVDLDKGLIVVDWDPDF